MSGLRIFHVTPYFTVLHWVKSSVCQQSTVTECILNLLDSLTAWGGGQLLPIFFIDLVSTNILLAMLGFPLSQKITLQLFCMALYCSYSYASCGRLLVCDISTHNQNRNVCSSSILFVLITNRQYPDITNRQ